jgi:hypothetical protein
MQFDAIAFPCRGEPTGRAFELCAHALGLSILIDTEVANSCEAALHTGLRNVMQGEKADYRLIVSN